MEAVVPLAGLKMMVEASFWIVPAKTTLIRTDPDGTGSIFLDKGYMVVRKREVFFFTGGLLSFSGSAGSYRCL